MLELAATGNKIDARSRVILLISWGHVLATSGVGVDSRHTRTMFDIVDFILVTRKTNYMCRQ